MKNNSNHLFQWMVVTVTLGGVALAALGCGSLVGTSGSSSSSGGLTLTGTYAVTTPAGVIQTQEDTTVEAVVAATSDGEKFLATLKSGSFSISMKKGLPALVGFFNKAKKLIAYISQKDADWQSLPLMDPRDSTTDIGAIDIVAGTTEASPRAVLADLIAKFKMSSAAAAAYGKIDDPMKIFSTVDVDGNGTFDFLEGKSYLFWADYQFKSSSQISKMQGQFNEEYRPQIESYTYALIFLDEKKSSAAGTPATLAAPGALSTTTLTGEAAANRTEWVISFGPVTAAAQPPAGKYVATVTGYGTLTFDNFQPSSISRIGSSEGIVFPVLKLSTNEAGEVTQVEYKWRIIDGGTARDATTSEITSQVEDTQKITTKGFIHGSPFIGFQFKSDGKGTSPVMLDRDGSSLSVTTVPIDGGGSRKVLLSDIQDLSITYNLTTRAVHRFHFSP